MIKLTKILISIILTFLIATLFWSVLNKNSKEEIKDQSASISIISDETSNNSIVDVLKLSLERIRLEAIRLASSEEITSSEEIITTAKNENIEDAIVKISCKLQTNEANKTITGTGFVISQNGLVITNAHIAQFLLLQNDNSLGEIDCEARTGEDMETIYNTKLLYISPSWVIRNAHLISATEPRGTGENDFAFIYLTSNDNKKIENFAFIPSLTSPLEVSEHDSTVILVGYPLNKSISQENTKTISTTTIKKMYTFGSGLADLISLDNSPVGYQGASGSPVINHKGESIGVVSTKEDDSTALNAISTSYINRTVYEETGFDINTMSKGNLDERAELFNETVGIILTKILSQNIK